MALDNKVLQDFFEKRKTLPANSQIKKIRVFDDPDYVRKDTKNTLSKTEDKVETKPETNQRQDNHKPETKWVQHIPFITQTKDKVESKSKTKLKTKWEQQETVVAELTTYSSLTGLQRVITLFIYDQCKIARSSITNQIAIEFLSIRCQTTKSSAKKTIQRLILKDVLARVAYKDGRNGWSKYQLNDQVYQEISYEESKGSYLSNWRQTGDKAESNPETQLKTVASSSSSLNKLTTNIETSELQESSLKKALPPEWENIDITPLEFIGFNINKLQQIYQAGNLSPEIVQDSIYAYAFDMDVNKVKHNSPINFIMSQLKVKGIPYEFPANYESPKDRAMRHYLEQKKAQRERSQQLKDLLKQEAFEEWLNNLPNDEQEQLVPLSQYAHGTNMRRAAFMNYYEKNIWPEKEKAVLSMVSQ